MDDTQEYATDQSLPEAQGQHRVGHVDKDDAAGAAIEGFAVGVEKSD